MSSRNKATNELYLHSLRGNTSLFLTLTGYHILDHQKDIFISLFHVIWASTKIWIYVPHDLQVVNSSIYKHVLFGTLQAPYNLFSSYLRIIPRVYMSQPILQQEGEANRKRCIFQKGKRVRVTTNVYLRKTLKKYKKRSANFENKGSGVVYA